MPTTCYITVSDIAVCQRCPMLLAYKVHDGYKSAWRVGMKGSGDYYGSLFHKYIAQVFFEAASDSRNKLHTKILEAIFNGAAALEEMIREEMFLPFVTKYSERLTSGQITSMARGVTTWVNAMYDFFREIPSLSKDAETVFIKPEGDLHGNFDFKDGDFEGRLVIKGRYDALMFNVDKREARLFEFKGLKKSDVTVPLSQSLIYAWLLYKSTGIIPSIEIIYLDEDEPIIFTSKTVRAMIISGLPGLFTTVYNVISLRRTPKILTDKELCKSCKYKTKCETNTKSLFSKKRAGASLLSVLIFFMAAMMIMTQAFFFATNSSESLIDERELVGIRMKLAEAVEYAKEEVKKETNVDVSGTPNATYADDVRAKDEKFYDGFYKETMKDKTSLRINGNITVNVHDLNYIYIEADVDNTKWETQTGKGKMHKKIFPPMGENYYLIRAYTKVPAGTWLMYQVLVKKDNDKVNVISFEEVWY